MGSIDVYLNKKRRLMLIPQIAGVNIS